MGESQGRWSNLELITAKLSVFRPKGMRGEQFPESGRRESHKELASMR